MKACICGFLGRYNSGDELMFEMHEHVLKSMGFSDVDRYTEDIQLSNVETNFNTYDQGKGYDLMLIGGGISRVGYGMSPSVFQKFERDAKVVTSSIKVHSSHVACGLYDGMITRVISEDIVKAHEKVYFLPDVVTIYEPLVKKIHSGKIGMIIRNHKGIPMDFMIEESGYEVDVLCLSKADLKVSQAYAEKHGYSFIDVHQEPAKSHVDLVASYTRIVSCGRYHAALYGAMHCDEYIYLQVDPRDEQAIPRGLYDWGSLTEFSIKHDALSKTGLNGSDLRNYPRASCEDYMNLFQKIMDS